MLIRFWISGGTNTGVSNSHGNWSLTWVITNNLDISKNQKEYLAYKIISKSTVQKP